MLSEGLDEVIKRGVPADAANKALQRGLKELIKEDWCKVFEPDNVKDQIESIT